MYGVSQINSDAEMMLISFTDADATFMTSLLNCLAEAGVVVDMISQTAPYGGKINFSFTAPYSYFDTALQAIGTSGLTKNISPMISGGYSKINLFGEEMVDSVGVAARALTALEEQAIEITMITTSDLDISLLVRSEDEDVAFNKLKETYHLI